MVLDMPAQEELRPCQEWAARDRRPRPEVSLAGLDAVFYLLNAMQ